jgi:RND family efflux transporter MFP subunit
MKRIVKPILKVLIPLIVIAAAVFGAVAMYKAKPEVKKHDPIVLPPLIRIHEVEISSCQFIVHSQGTVSPRTESLLVAEVSGRVIEVSDSFVTGGFFEAGDALVRIDPSDYRQAVSTSRANVARMKLQLAREEAEAEVARREWKDLGKGEATPLTLHEPQLADARAALEAADAALEQAERDLSRTELRAPYAGRVRIKIVDVGQFITRGSPAGTIYAVDYAEIRLPLADEDLAYLDLPLIYRGGKDEQPGPAVMLTADFAGREYSWQGRIVRTEGEIDPASRLVHVVARVKNPYGRGEDPDRPPLAVGLYVRAEIDGRIAKDVAALPRAALRGDDTVLVVDDENRLRFRKVRILRRTRETVVIGSGLSQGERVCVSPLEAVTDGMKVRPLKEGEEPGQASDGASTASDKTARTPAGGLGEAVGGTANTGGSDEGNVAAGRVE